MGLGFLKENPAGSEKIPEGEPVSPPGIFSLLQEKPPWNEKIPEGGTEPPQESFSADLGFPYFGEQRRIPEGGTHFSEGNGVPGRELTKRSLVGWVTSPRHLLQWAGIP